MGREESEFNMTTKKIEEGSTAHKQVPAPTESGPAGGSENMPMGMTGQASGGDPDQKSTHVAPKTVESNLPDGSPRFADPGKVAPKTKAKAGTYRVLSAIRTGGKTYEAGAEVELDADEASSLGGNVEKA